LTQVQLNCYSEYWQGGELRNTSLSLLRGINYCHLFEDGLFYYIQVLGKRKYQIINQGQGGEEENVNVQLT
jgi:hypothetical protein